MWSDEGAAPDWRDADAYAPLLEADRSILAWEWLRRDSGYRSAWRTLCKGAQAGERGAPGPETWGLHTFEPPYRTVPDARPVWRADVHPFVLRAAAERSVRSADSLELDGLGANATLVTAANGREHLLISNGLRSIRVDLVSGSLKDGPVCMHYLISGLESAERPTLALRRLLSLLRNGRFSSRLHPLEARAKRWLLMLRACDALAAGAGQREIAAVLLSGEAGEPRWRSSSPSLRSRAQRLVRGARRMASGGYLELLR